MAEDLPGVLADGGEGALDPSVIAKLFANVLITSMASSIDSFRV